VLLVVSKIVSKNRVDSGELGEIREDKG